MHMHVRRQQIINALRFNGGEAPLSMIRAIPGLGASALLNHHIQNLQDGGFIEFDNNTKIVKLIKGADAEVVITDNFIRIPIYGSANCGPGTIFAEEYVTGQLSITANALNDLARKAINSLAAVTAIGDSMNNADIDGNNIEEGDFVLVNRADRELVHNRCFLVVLNETAMIKRLSLKHGEGYGLLLSDSKKEKNPIVVTTSDNFAVSGRVIQVFKHA